MQSECLGRGVPPAETVVSGHTRVTDVILSQQAHAYAKALRPQSE